MQQIVGYVNGLKFPIQDKMGLQPIWTVDEAQNLAIRAA